MVFTEESLVNLKEKVKTRMSEKRFSHTLGVERCAQKLGNLVLSDKTNELRAAAILHDISKEMPIEEQFRILEKNAFQMTEEDRATIGVIHSFTAPFVVAECFGDFATEDVLSSVFNHTLGCENMSTFDKIIFVSDYAEDTRKFASCIAVREFLFDKIEELNPVERMKRLDEAFLMALNGVLEALSRLGQPINSRIYITKKYLEKHILQN